MRIWLPCLLLTSADTCILIWLFCWKHPGKKTGVHSQAWQCNWYCACPPASGNYTTGQQYLKQQFPGIKQRQCKARILERREPGTTWITSHPFSLEYLPAAVPGWGAPVDGSCWAEKAHSRSSRVLKQWDSFVGQCQRRGCCSEGGSGSLSAGSPWVSWAGFPWSLAEGNCPRANGWGEL